MGIVDWFDVVDGLEREKKVIDTVSMVLSGDEDSQGLAVILERSSDSLGQIIEAVREWGKTIVIDLVDDDKPAAAS